MASIKNRDLVLARDFEPKARRRLIFLAILLMALGYTGYAANQTLTVLVLPDGGSETPVARLGERGFSAREAGLSVLPGLIAGALGGAGFGILLYAFAHPMVRHRALPYVLLVLLGQLLAAITMPEILRVTEETTGVIHVTTGPIHAASDLLDFVEALIPSTLFVGAIVFIAWALLRPEDFEGTAFHRRYLARDLPPPEG
ncbi:MAG TPA: hypothetical protein VNZ52_01530, partial [Candidatus Thermoplasmatota archaeon]|nr:hypothetical protein [Candidatus Thermoplasmatota archaeon]